MKLNDAITNLAIRLSDVVHELTAMELDTWGVPDWIDDTEQVDRPTGYVALIGEVRWAAGTNLLHVTVRRADAEEPVVNLRVDADVIDRGDNATLARFIEDVRLAGRVALAAGGTAKVTPSSRWTDTA